MFVFNSVNFLDPQGVAVAEHGAAVPGIEKIFQDAGYIPGSLGQDRFHPCFSGVGQEAFEVGLEFSVLVVKHEGEDTLPAWQGQSRSRQIGGRAVRAVWRRVVSEGAGSSCRT